MGNGVKKKKRMGNGVSVAYKTIMLRVHLQALTICGGMKVTLFFFFFLWCFLRFQTIFFNHVEYQNHVLTNFVFHINSLYLFTDHLQY